MFYPISDTVSLLTKKEHTHNSVAPSQTRQKEQY